MRAHQVLHLMSPPAPSPVSLMRVTVIVVLVIVVLVSMVFVVLIHLSGPFLVGPSPRWSGRPAPRDDRGRKGYASTWQTPLTCNDRIRIAKSARWRAGGYFDPSGPRHPPVTRVEENTAAEGIELNADQVTLPAWA
jgi:hypothetical protein